MMLLASCASSHEDAVAVNHFPIMYPDYTDVTIPVNIAPLNFLIRDKHVTNMETVLTIIDTNPEPETMSVKNLGCNVEFNESDWKNFLQKAVDKKIQVQIFSHNDEDQWTEYKTFYWTVVGDSIDPYITYQLIEPDYRIWNNIEIRQRCVENFREKIIANAELQNNRCMNCHITGNQNPNLSMIYLHEDGRDAILNRNGKLRRLNIQNSQTLTPSVYFNFSPTGKYMAFSTNEYEPAFHAAPTKRIEVYDDKSDIHVADLDNNKIISTPLTTSPNQLETFPCFSPDGKYIYYCAANSKGLETSNLKGLKYALVRIPFDEERGTFGNKVDTLYNARSVCHPRISPNGRYCLFTVADYGTCPAWHPEADLCMLDLQTGKLDNLGIVNSNKSDAYHSWSHNSRWFVFGSKRGDGIYSKPYFCYIDKEGKAHKPFLLPQKEPTFYDDCLKCFNIPELIRDKVPFNAIDIENVMKQTAEDFK